MARATGTSRELSATDRPAKHLLDDRQEQHGGEEDRGEPDQQANEPHGHAYRTDAVAHRQGAWVLRKRGRATTLSIVPDSFKEFEATSLFCNRCKRATPVRKQLLLVLPTGNKYDYRCG